MEIMRYIRRVLLMLLAVVFITGAYGCGFGGVTKTPTEVTSETLDNIKSGDSNKIQNIFEGNGLIKINSSKGLSVILPSSSDKMKKLLQNINYNVNSERIDGDDAVVNVTVTGPDLNEVFDKLISNMVNDIKSGELTSDNFDMNKMSAKYDGELSELLENVKTSERTGDIELEKSRGKWVIDDENEICRLAVNIDPDEFMDKYDLSSSDLLKLIRK